jgi:hypothetical protein
MLDARLPLPRISLKSSLFAPGQAWKTFHAAGRIADDGRLTRCTVSVARPAKET